MQVAYFFVPLVEPLGLPDGFVFEFTRSETYEEWSKRERLGNCAPRDHEGPTLVASLKFWRANAITDNPGGMRTLFDIARQAFPNVPSREASAKALKVERTVVEVAVPLTSSGSDPLTEAFETGLNCLRTFQRGYHLIGGRQPLTLASRERMPVAIPAALRDTEGEENNWPSELEPFLLNTNIYADTRLPDLTDTQLEALTGGIGAAADRRVFYGYIEGSRAARLALDRDGDYRVAVLFASMAAEVLLDDLLAHLFWEEAVRPEDAAVVFDGFLVSRVKREYQARLGGNWVLTGSGALANWSEKLAKLRHRIIHAGYEPDRPAAVAATNALAALESFLTERLSTAAVLKQYPRTAIAMMGRPGLKRRGKWSRRLQSLIDSTDEPLWGETFNRWRAAMNRCRAEGSELADRPGHKRAFVLRCLLPDGGAYWCAHDRLAFMAGLLPDPPAGAIDPMQREGLDTSEQTLRLSAIDEPVSIALLDVRPWAAPASWRPEYRVVPMAGVMVNMNDLDPDLAQA